MSDNDLKFTSKTVEDFANRRGIIWKQVTTYNPQGNGIAERMVGTMKRGIQKMSRDRNVDWDVCLDSVLYGYRRRMGPDGKSPFEILYGVPARFPHESNNYFLKENEKDMARKLEISMVLSMRAERLVPRMISGERKFSVGDKVLLRRGMAPTGPKIEAKMWFGPFEITSANHPRYVLKNAPGRISRKAVHVRRLRKYFPREEENLGLVIENNDDEVPHHQA